MDSIIDRVKEKIRIEDVVARDVKLIRRDERSKGLCPFHAEDTASFFVFEDSQRAHCFGCGWDGDVFDYVQEREGWDIREAIRELAREAGVDVRPLTPQEQERRARVKSRERVFELATQFFQTRLRDGAGRAYALGRGFAEKSLEHGRIGYFGEDWGLLRQWLQAHDVDVEAPAAVALLGYRGDVSGWAQAHDVCVENAWVRAGKIRAMLPNVLVYPFLDHGRVVYLQGRNTADQGPRMWNPPRQLAGAKPSYYNWEWRGSVERAFVVEGPACAITLAQWGHAAVAEPTARLRALERDRDHNLLAALANVDHVLVATDQDGPGTAVADVVARALMADEDHDALHISLVTWPEHDANDWLQALVSAGVPDSEQYAQLRAVMSRAPTWYTVLLERATSDGDAVRELFAALARLDLYDVSRLRNDVSDTLKMRSPDFDALLKSARIEAGKSEDGRLRYEVIGGQVCHRTFDRYGTERVYPLCNFSAEIVGDVLVDDGEAQDRAFEISGQLATGEPLPALEVRAEDFQSMGWVLPGWGARASIAAGSGTKDHLRAAIQELSRDIEMRQEYAHLGWRSFGDAKAYLTRDGAIGGPEARVRLPTEFEHYRIPLHPERDARDAMAASVDFWNVGSFEATVTLWSTMFLAPLCEILPPAFSLWMYGTTGSFKSTLTALAMCHYGEFTYDSPPGSWTSTAFSLRRLLFLAKDAPFWIDDYAPQATASAQQDIIKRSDTLLREWGNRVGRSAGTAEGKLRNATKPRGVAIGTAEMLPPGPSIMPRLYAVQMGPETIDDTNVLTRYQEESAQIYPDAMAHYLLWVGSHWDEIREWAPTRMRELRSLARREMRHHRRTAPNVATLATGMEAGLRYAREVLAIDAHEHEGLLAMGWDILMGVGIKQDEGVNKEADPVMMFTDALAEMLAQGAVFLRHQFQHDNNQLDWPGPGKKSTHSEFLGWWGSEGDDVAAAQQLDYNKSTYWYLLPSATINAVTEFYHHAGVMFPASRRTLQTQLSERDMLLPNSSQPYLYQMPSVPGRPRVWRILRPDNKQNGCL